MTALAILQSGFVTEMNDRLMLPNVNPPDISQIIIKPYKQQHASHYYAKYLDDIITEYTTQSNNVRSFDFRDRFLKELMLVMNSISFKKWVYRQADSTMLNNLNIKFLIDTLNFLAGKEREYDAASWSTLVEANASSIDREHLMKLLECYFGDRMDHYLYDGPILPPSITDIIQVWTCKTGGFKDMVCSMDVIFGDKKRISIVGTGQLAGGTPTDFTPVLTFNSKS